MSQAAGGFQSRIHEKRRKKDALRKVRLVKAILRKWDPINLAGLVEDWPRDEYDRYAQAIVSMVTCGAGKKRLADQLEYLRTESIGVEANRARDEEIACEILATADGKSESG